MEQYGYKVFNPDWTCRDFKYEIGKTYTHSGDISLCREGFHYCIKLVDCFNYYSFDPANKVAKIKATGKIINSDDKSVTNTIEILEELSWKNVLEMCNTGNYNTGYRNTGNHNTGNYNTGYRNAGNRNTGYFNTGYFNTGYGNAGNRNTGNYNTGDFNTGDYNTGYSNAGNYNTGDSNTGDYNTGYFNTGNYNTGDSNTGDFNTITPYVTVFNKPTTLTLKEYKLKYNNILSYIKRNLQMSLWINYRDMSVYQKKKHPEAKVVRGYVKIISYKKAWKKLWKETSNEMKLAIQSLPNFDKEVFEEITGIKV